MRDANKHSQLQIEEDKNYIRICIDKREEWLRIRNQKFHDHYLIGASESAKVVNRSPFGSSVDVFDAKINGKSKDISGLPSVRYGIEAEDPMRKLAALDFAQWFTFSYAPYDILVSKKIPCMSTTLDGEITVKTDDNPWSFAKGTPGIFENKTGSMERGSGEGWFIDHEKTIPTDYYIQGLHEMAVKEASFVLFQYRLKREGYKDGEQELPQIRTGYRLLDRRAEGVEEDIAWLRSELTRFETEYLIPGIRPSQVFRF